jgi:hypothetical protein
LVQIFAIKPIKKCSAEFPNIVGGNSTITWFVRKGEFVTEYSANNLSAFYYKKKKYYYFVADNYASKCSVFIKKNIYKMILIKLN